jgi:hypothetical protein
MRLLNLTLLSLLLFSCGKKSADYVHHYNPPRLEVDDRRIPLSTLDIEGDIDILWVIDNSGSMSTIQNNVIKNAKIFMEQFARQKYINWKMGLVSTDRSERPYLGFERSFDYSLINHADPTSIDKVVNEFQTAVRSLGTNGDYIELTFYNIIRVLQEFDGSHSTRPPFLRSRAHLAVIMVTDEEEQSVERYGAQYEAYTFLNTLAAFVSQNRTIRFYGAFDFMDLQDCRSGYGVRYKGSPFEAVIDATGGFHISACVSDFGTKLVDIGKDIASLAGRPSLLLNNRPKLHTLKVFYKNQEIPAGKPEDGGFWYYDDKFNTINFYSLEFVDDLQTASFRIKFDIDDGIDRPGDPSDSF